MRPPKKAGIVGCCVEVLTSMRPSAPRRALSLLVAMARLPGRAGAGVLLLAAPGWARGRASKTSSRIARFCEIDFIVSVILLRWASIAPCPAEAAISTAVRSSALTMFESHLCAVSTSVTPSGPARSNA